MASKSEKDLASMKTNTLMSGLKSKYADRSWNETFQLVRRCMEKTKGDGRVCEPITKCLEKINEALNVSSLTSMVSRLEMIANQRGLGSHLSPSETVYYLTADTFYVEVLLPRGRVENVRVARQGEAPVSSPSLLQLLRMKKFQEFSLKLEDLASFYNIQGDCDVKVKIYAALRHLEADLFKISNLPRSLRESDLHVDLIMNGRIGNIQPGRDGMPMTVEYYISPLDVLRGLSDTGEVSVGQVALVMVGSSDASHRLQMESLISSPPQLDSLGFPEFQPLTDSCSELLPATFLLKLQPPLPMLISFIEKMGKITDGVMAEQHLQMEPLPQILMKTSKKQISKIFQPLPACEYHSYVFPGAEWSQESWKGDLIYTVPFYHPGHIPALLEVLRHQSAINVLLASCFSNHNHRMDAGLQYDLRCEVFPESDHCLSVTFSLDCSNHLDVLHVMVVDSHQMSCRLLMPDFADHNLDDYISRVLMRCMSIPITMRAIRRKVSSLTTRPLPEADPELTTPVESISTPYSDESVPVESISTPYSDEYVPVESTSTTCSDEYVPVESTSTTYSDESVPVESTSTLYSDEYVPMESTSTTYSDESVPVESTSTPYSDESVPVESTSTTYSDESVPVESTSTPYSDESVPVESTSTPHSDESVPETMSAVHPSTSVTREAVEEEIMTFSPGDYVSVASPVSDNANTDAVANPSPVLLWVSVQTGIPVNFLTSFCSRRHLNQTSEQITCHEHSKRSIDPEDDDY